MKLKTTTTKFNMEKRDYLSLTVLAAGCLLIVLILTRGKFLYGSTVDWISQHSVLPEYFRSRFYETGKLIPEFAPELGGGQNLFHFSYYGFLSPIVLVSYLLPGVAMTDYIAASMIVLVIASGALFYLWLRRRGIGIPAAFTAAFLFQFSAPLLYHSHKQIMFVNYMPFLLLALIGTDLYFEKKKSFLMMTGTFLMIMTSYFYSVGGLLVLTIYGIYTWLRIDQDRVSPDVPHKKGALKRFVKAGIPFAIRLLIPVCMSALLILPSLTALLSGRGSDGASGAGAEGLSLTDLQTLLFPSVKLENFLYGPYGTGLTAISVFAFFRLFKKGRKPERILGILLGTIFAFPLFLYILNGGLYLRGKVFLPFLPVLLLITADLFEDLYRRIQNRQTSSDSSFGRRRFLVTVLFLALLFVLDGGPIGLAFLADGVIAVICIAAALRKRNFLLVCLPSILLVFGICVGVNISDRLVPLELKEEACAPEKLELMKAIDERDPGYYRTNNFTNTLENCNQAFIPGIYLTSLYSSCYSREYNLFHSDIMGSSNGATNSIACRDSGNLLFQSFMGVKYLITENSEDAVVPAGYRKITERGGYALYENNEVFPVAFGSSRLMGKEEFEDLKDIDRSIALLQNIIVDRAPESGFTSPLTAMDFSLPLKKTQSGNAYKVESREPQTVELPLDSPLNERLLLLEFYFRDVPARDIVIEANQTANRLTGKNALYPNQNFNFHYVISDAEPKQTLTLDFSAGNYELLDPRLYSMDASLVSDAARSVTPLKSGRPESSGTVLSGSIEMEEDGYFTASIPYDKGFTARVDGIERKVELVNTAFIGFPLEKGMHTIEIDYHAPLFAAGKKISAAAVIAFFIVLALEWIFNGQRLSDKVYLSDKLPKLKGRPQALLSQKKGDAI